MKLAIILCTIVQDKAKLRFCLRESFRSYKEEQVQEKKSAGILQQTRSKKWNFLNICTFNVQQMCAFSKMLRTVRLKEH